MITPLVTWSCIAALMLAIIIVRLIRAIKRCKNNTGLVFFEMANEEEQFWIPGDRLKREIGEEDYDDFEDL